jgi:hypothetical protein
MAAAPQRSAAWPALPPELLARCLALALAREAPLSTLLAPARVCRAWAAAYRDDALWCALFAAAWPGEAAAGAAASRSWRERFVAHALALPLLASRDGAATEQPMEALFDSTRRVRRETVLAAAGGHVCGLSSGRLALAHVRSAAPPDTAVLLETRTDGLSGVVIAPWAGGAACVSVCLAGPRTTHKQLPLAATTASRRSVIEVTPLGCCAAAPAHAAGVPVKRIEVRSEVTAVAAAPAPRLMAGCEGALLVAYALRRDHHALLCLKLLLPRGVRDHLEGGGGLQCQVERAAVTALCFELHDGAAQSLLVGTMDGGALMRWQPAGLQSAWPQSRFQPLIGWEPVPLTAAAPPTDCTRLRALAKVSGIAAAPCGAVVAWGDTPAGSLAMLLLPPAAAASGGGALNQRTALPLLPASRPLHAAAASLGAFAVATAAGDVELVHAGSGRALGRVFTSSPCERLRRVQLAPAGPRLGLLSVAHSGLGVRVLLHAPSAAAASGAAAAGCAACAGAGCAACAGAAASAARPHAPTRVARPAWADALLPLDLVHV